ncbi:MAG TPA: DUF459 domain-containing protein [Hyphomicrobium sp.]|nr:DUF459 domain-containing protein [Hyphomicrobium sp.]
MLSRSRPVRLRPALVALLAAVLAVAAPVAAQDEPSGTSFINPFPPGDVYNLVIVGDDLADGLLGGAREVFQRDARVVVRQTPLPMNGLMRPSYHNLIVQVEEDLKAASPQIAVLMMGSWDRVSVRDASGRRHRVGSDGWRAEYTARVDRLLKLLRRYNVAVYWAGLPPARRYDFNEDVQMMNNILRERAYLNGAKYIDVYAAFATEGGGYSAYGPDVTGKNRLLRSGDGVYFTWEGNRKLAYFVDREVRRDLAQAQADRAIPLDGSEAEQAKINPDAVKFQDPKSGTEGSPAAGAAKARQTQVTDGAAEQKADTSRINLRIVSEEKGTEEVVTVELVRPAIPASVIALVTRRESADRLSQIGEAVLDQIPGGLTVMSTVALATSPGTPGAARRRLAPSQAPYFRVLFKGERLTPQPGRADDTAWPRPEPPPAAAYLNEDPVETGTTAAAEVAQPPAKSTKRR